MRQVRDRQATQRQDKIAEVHYKPFPSLAAIASITNKPTNTSTDRQEYIAKVKVSQFTAKPVFTPELSAGITMTTGCNPCEI